MLNVKSLLNKILTNMVSKQGDQNLLQGASTISNGSSNTWSNGLFRSSGSGGTVAYNQSITPPSGFGLPSKGAIITATSANTQIGFCQDSCPVEKKVITQSIWVKGNNGDKIDLQPIWSGTSGEEESGSKRFTLTDSEWHHITYTKTPNYAHSSVSMGYVYVYAGAANNKVYFLAPKIEYGDVPTAWDGNAKMSGLLKTSFKSAPIIGSKQATSTTVPNLLTELNGKYQMGSANLSRYTSGGIVVPAGWYNYVSFASDYILLLGMTVGQRAFIVTPPYTANNVDYPIYISEIQINNKTAKYGMTNSSTTNYALNGTSGTRYYYIKEGNKVTVNFNVKCNSRTTSMTQFASGLPTHNRPTAISFPLACETPGQRSTIDVIWAQVNTDGTISAMYGTAGKYYYGSICYMTNDG